MVPENPVAFEIIEFSCVAGVGFCGHVNFVPMVLPRVLPHLVRQPIGDPCASTSDRCAATKDSQTQIETGRSTFMGMVVSMLAPMAVGAPDGETGHRYWLAPPRVPLVLDLEGPTRTCRAAKRSERNTGTDPDSQPE